LVESSSVGQGSPLLESGSGRLWASSDGRVRLELQSEHGDAEILWDGTNLTVYDTTSNTVYKLAVPSQAQGRTSTDGSGLPSVADIERVLAQLAKDANVSGATPSDVAGDATYTVQVAPKHDGGLLGSIQLAWDASNGTPLRAAVYAAGNPSPVLELAATEIGYGPVESSAFALSVPSGAHVVDLAPPAAGPGGAEVVTGVPAVQSKLSFNLAAPSTLAGLPRREVRLASANSKDAALVTYGEGLGGIAVLETASDSGSNEKTLESLPTVSINGSNGHELATALGTVLTFRRAGVQYTVIGSVPAAAAEAAARAL
jgi:outer membrane lipoprotein-sorting protein